VAHTCAAQLATYTSNAPHIYPPVTGVHK
jgi:hypothetical protein